MADYGDNTSVEVLVWGVADTDYDTKAASARTVASDIIDAKLGNRNRETSPTSRINSAANLIAASILASKPGEMVKNDWFTQALQIVEEIRGTVSDDADWGYIVSVQKQSTFPTQPANNQTWDEDGN